MTPLRQRMGAVALVATALFALAGCSDGQPDRPAVSAAAEREALVRRLMAPYEARLGSAIVDYIDEDGHIGVYLKADPAWSLDRYVEALPIQAQAARELLVALPAADDVDICADGPWLPREYDIPYATAARVQVFRDRLDRVPATFARPADVLRSSLREKLFDVYVDPKISVGAPLWQAELRASR